MNYQIGHMSVTINYHTGCVMIIMDDYQIGCMCMTIIQDDYQISVCVCMCVIITLDVFYSHVSCILSPHWLSQWYNYSGNMLPLYIHWKCVIIMFQVNDHNTVYVLVIFNLDMWSLDLCDSISCNRNTSKHANLSKRRLKI